MMERTWRSVLRNRVHPEHMKMEDPRLKGHRGVYFIQAAVAGGNLFLVLAAENALVNGAVLAAIASTAFVLMVTPHSVVATPATCWAGTPPARSWALSPRSCWPPLPARPSPRTSGCSPRRPVRWPSASASC